jgi:NAD(P)H-hydrate epimerase
MLREPIRKAVAEIVEWRNAHGAVVVAIDVPSGLDADTGVQDDWVVEADLTLTIGAPKRGLLHPDAVNAVGRIELIPLGEGEFPASDADHCLIVPGGLGRVLSPRPHDFHKGQAGRLSIIAGSEGMEGAAVLCANAALRVGAGMVTLWVPENARSGVMARVFPEVMVRGYRFMREIEWEKADAFVMGPGCGRGVAEDFLPMADLVLRTELPGVMDADALNAIARHEGHHIFREHHVLTPHAGEFARLAPDLIKGDREEMCRNFTAHHDAVLLLKGARTLVHQRGCALHHNSTGHAGMATAGMGDVLSGMIGGLLAQGESPFEAACLGAWLAGRAAEMATPRGSHSLRSLIASDLLATMGRAMAEWETTSCRQNLHAQRVIY